MKRNWFLSLALLYAEGKCTTVGLWNLLTTRHVFFFLKRHMGNLWRWQLRSKNRLSGHLSNGQALSKCISFNFYAYSVLKRYGAFFSSRFLSDFLWTADTPSRLYVWKSYWCVFWTNGITVHFGSPLANGKNIAWRGSWRAKRLVQFPR